MVDLMLFLTHIGKGGWGRDLDRGRSLTDAGSVINSLGQSILTGVRRLAHWLVGENFTP
jgi:hypothetical protein